MNESLTSRKKLGEDKERINPSIQIEDPVVGTWINADVDLDKKDIGDAYIVNIHADGTGENFYFFNGKVKQRMKSLWRKLSEYEYITELISENGKFESAIFVYHPENDTIITKVSPMMVWHRYNEK